MSSSGRLSAPEGRLGDGSGVGTADVRRAAEDLVAEMAAEPWGRASASVYETGRLVALAGWLTGHRRRLDFLLRTQRADGGWGAPPPGYALGPTLSATDAIVAALADPETACAGRPPVLGRDSLVEAANRGLRILSGWLAESGGRRLSRADLPDMPAIELIVPSLAASLNRRLAGTPPRGLEGWRGHRLGLPAGLDDSLLTSVSARLAAGGDVPRKLVHALEIAGPAAVRQPRIRPEATGTVGAAPAASAAWLGGGEVPPPDDPTRRYLERAVRQHAGPVPCTLPITTFERAWVLSWLLRAGLRVAVPPELTAGLRAALGPRGTAAADGLPADADTTAGAVYALGLLGAPPDPRVLDSFATESHFATWPGEDGFSVTTNAHVLEAYGRYLQHLGGRPPQKGDAAAARDRAPDVGTVVGKVASWLRDRQGADGSWRDRWHASPYYATFCCALALDRYGGRESRAAVDRARRWVVETQRPDGSWGVWRGTAEETAYAMQILLLTGRGDGREGAVAAKAVAAGRDRLLRVPFRPTDPAMWHDKDLYLPTTIVRAAILGALYRSAPQL